MGFPDLILAGTTAVIAASACPSEMMSTVNGFYARYLQDESSSPAVSLDTFIKRNRASLDPALYRDLLAASSRKPSDGRAYLDFQPFVGHQVRTYRVNSVGCSMVNRKLGMVELRMVAGLSIDRASVSCRRVEMINQAGRWRIKDVLFPRDEGETSSGRSSPECGTALRYGRLSESLRQILVH